MQGELVTAVTADYVRLNGLFCRSQARLRTSEATGLVDGAMLVHGLGGNFYSSQLLLHVAETLLELGVHVLMVNTRGHDMINTLAWAGRSQSVGAALENVEHCRFDLNAWTDVLLERGVSRVMWLGHSLGAIKSLYAMTQAPHPKVVSLVALSATRLSYRKMLASPHRESFRATIERCEQLVAADQGLQPIEVKFPFSTWMTPACYLDKYGSEEKFNWENFIDRVTIPSLLLFGEKELNETPGFIGLAEQLGELKQRLPSFTIDIVPDADHFYTSKFDEVDDRLTRWLTRN